MSWDVSRFVGQKAQIQVVDSASGDWGHINVDHIVQTDRPERLPTQVAPLYQEAFRPQFHFTARQWTVDRLNPGMQQEGWVNDLNGLIYYDGEYHLFAQRWAKCWIHEERRLGIALTGRRNPVFWSGADRDARADVYDLKGTLEEFFEQFRLRGLTYTRRAEPTPIFLESAVIQLGKNVIGEIGQLSPALAKQYDLRDAVLLAELNFDLLLSRRSGNKSFKPLPAFPTIRRDLALLVAESVTHGFVEVWFDIGKNGIDAIASIC